MPSAMKPTAIDLFSGCGGLTLGLKQAGFRLIGAVEVDPLAVETYKANHRHIKVWEIDIRRLAVAEVMRHLKLDRGELDLLAGCPPCQGFSRLTTLNGERRQRDRRNDLVFQLLRFVRGLRPKAVMMENVPGLSKNRRIKEIITALESMGYRVRHAVLDAADYGVPQRRRRFILIAGRNAEVSFGRRARRRWTVRDAFRKLGPRSATDPLHILAEKRSEQVQELIRKIPRNGGGRRQLADKHQLGCHRRCDGFGDVYGRMAWDEVAPTITGGCCNPSKGRFLHPTKNRNVTLREAALLQTFPRNYRFSLRRGKFATAQMIGNALPPEFIRRQAKALKTAVSGMTAPDRTPKHVPSA